MFVSAWQFNSWQFINHLSSSSKLRHWILNQRIKEFSIKGSFIGILNLKMLLVWPHHYCCRQNSNNNNNESKKRGEGYNTVFWCIIFPINYIMIGLDKYILSNAESDDVGAQSVVIGGTIYFNSIFLNLFKFNLRRCMGSSGRKSSKTIWQYRLSPLQGSLFWPLSKARTPSSILG